MNKIVKLKPEVKAAWVKALRSGKYRQGYTHLRSRLDGGYAYCCLGVLMLTMKKRIKSTAQLPPGSLDVWVEGAWPGKIRPKEINPYVYYEFMQASYSLSELNDVYELSFTQIADIIEEQL
jgi:hypothetical protein